ncbi:MAG: hypothetical protein ABIJ74_00630 [archaeon]
MICFIALIVFAVLGIFSAKYREYAKEAFDCVFRRLTLRKCEAAFDKKMKTKVTAKIMKTSPHAGGIVFKHFELISWALTILMVLSLAYSAIGVYNFVVYNNCNGPQGGECIYSDLTGATETVSCGSLHCADYGCDCNKGCDESNDFAACNGNCDCIEAVCGQ